MTELNLEDKPSGERRGRHRRDEGFGDGPRVNWTFLVTVIALCAGWAAAGFSDNRDLVSRVRALEAQRVEDSRRIERIENKIDDSADKLDRVLAIVK